MSLVEHCMHSVALLSKHRLALAFSLSHPTHPVNEVLVPAATLHLVWHRIARLARASCNLLLSLACIA